MKIKWDGVFTVMLIGCALVTTAVVVHREFVGRTSSYARTPAQKPVFIQNWRSDLGQGVQFGSMDAPVQLIEFADFECPFCGSFHQTLKTLRERYPNQVTLTFMHFPIPGHRFALPAARVAECAGDQGRFEAMYDRLFDQQDSFGLKSWAEFAGDAGVPDRVAFESCIQKKDSVPRITKGLELGKRLDIQGTPTLIINGWELGRTPSASELDTMVKAVLGGKNPVAEVHKS